MATQSDFGDDERREINKTQTVFFFLIPAEVYMTSKISLVYSFFPVF